MYNILTLDKISNKGLKQFDSKYTCFNDINDPDAILVRSSSMHNMAISDSLLAIARAGVGINNIPIERCSEKGVVVFNTPGANANAVKELAIAGLLLASRDIVGSIDWAKSLKGNNGNVEKLVETGKKNFVGPELIGKKLGVIGLGSIGTLVANSALDLGMQVYGYDPYLSIESAWRLSSNVKNANSLEIIFSECDYITIHVPLNDSTKNIINKQAIEKMKNGVRILNLSRAGLVNSIDIIEAVESKKVSRYVTDFPTDELLSVDGIITIPHLGGSTPESEDNCAFMAVGQIIDYLENGNITNSINLPNISMPRECGPRLCVIHKNIPNMIGAISTELSNHSINIENMQSKSRGNNAYAMFDLNKQIPESILQNLLSIKGIIRTRIIK